MGWSAWDGGAEVQFVNAGLRQRAIMVNVRFALIAPTFAGISTFRGGLRI